MLFPKTRTTASLSSDDLNYKSISWNNKNDNIYKNEVQDIRSSDEYWKV